MSGKIPVAAQANGLPRLPRPTPAPHLGSLAFQLFIDRKEVLDFSQRVREDLVDGMNLIEARIPIGHCEDFLIRLIAIQHLQQPYGAHGNKASGKACLFDHRQHVQRIAIFSQRPGDKPIVSGVMHWRIERAIQTEDAQAAVVLILVRGILRNLHNHADDLRHFRTGIQVIKLRRHPLRVTKTQRATKTWSSRISPRPVSEMITFMMLHVRSVWPTDIPKYWLTSQNPASLT